MSKNTTTSSLYLTIYADRFPTSKASSSTKNTTAAKSSDKGSSHPENGNAFDLKPESGSGSDDFTLTARFDQLVPSLPIGTTTSSTTRSSLRIASISRLIRRPTPRASLLTGRRGEARKSRCLSRCLRSVEKGAKGLAEELRTNPQHPEFKGCGFTLVSREDPERVVRKTAKGWGDWLIELDGGEVDGEDET